MGTGQITGSILPEKWVVVLSEQSELETSFAVEDPDVYDPFQDEEPLECSLEDPEICESCQ